MNEIDLIPQEYRIRQWQRRYVKIATIAIATLLCAHAGAYVATRAETHAIETEVAALQSEQRISEQHRQDLEQLAATQQNYAEQLRLLGGLRSGATAEQLFVTVERALETDDVWFLNWRFQRSGIVVETRENYVNSGYFIVVPTNGNDRRQRPWQVRTHMTIHGQSSDHSALSGFVKALFSQPEIDDVHLGRTTMGYVGAREVVDFDLAIVMNTDAEVE